MNSDYFTREAERQLQALLAANREAAACEVPATRTGLDARPYSAPERSALGAMTGYDDDDSDYTWVTCDGSSDDEDGSDTESSSDDSSSSDDDDSMSSSSSSSSEECSSSEHSSGKGEKDNDEQATDKDNMTKDDVPVQMVENAILLDDLKSSTSQEVGLSDPEPTNQLTFDRSDRSLDVEEALPTEKGSSTEEGSSLLILCCLQSSDREVTTRQTRTHALLLARKIHYDAIDGSDPANAEARDELFQLSGRTRQYPLFFRRKGCGTVEYIGDFETLEWINDRGVLNSSMSQLEPTNATENSDAGELEVHAPTEDATAIALPRSATAKRAADDKAEAKARARREADEKVARVKRDAEKLAKQLEEERAVTEKLARAHHEAMETLERERQEQEKVQQRQAPEQALPEDIETARRVKEAGETAIKEKLEAEESTRQETKQEASQVKQETELLIRIDEEARAESERLQAERQAYDAEVNARKTREEESQHQADENARRQREKVPPIEEKMRQDVTEFKERAGRGQREVKEPDVSKHSNNETLAPPGEVNVESKRICEQEVTVTSKMVEVARDGVSTESDEEINCKPMKLTKTKKERAHEHQVRRKSHKKVSFSATESEFKPKAQGERQTSGKMFLRLPKAKLNDVAPSPPPSPAPSGSPPTEAEQRRAALRRLQRCYEWYGKLGQPTRVKMRERIARIHASIGVTPDDVDAMPWTATGRLNVIEMNRIFLQQV